MSEQQSTRDSFQSRLGFILVSAGCAIGIGNVWKFPYLCGQYGGAAFILLYLLFLLILGIPVLLCEFALGRSSRQSVARCFDRLAPAGSRWPRLQMKKPSRTVTAIQKVISLGEASIWAKASAQNAASASAGNRPAAN